MSYIVRVIAKQWEKDEYFGPFQSSEEARSWAAGIKASPFTVVSLNRVG